VVSSQWSVGSQNVDRAFLPGHRLPTQSYDERLPITQPFRRLINTRQKTSFSIATELVLGGRRMGFSPCRYPRNPSGHESVSACVWCVPWVRLRFRPEGSFSDSTERSPGSSAPPKIGIQSLKGRFQSASGLSVMHGFRVLTHPALLKPALQAWRASLGCLDQVLTHLALLRSALQA
jgi:hypothetical protein